jgi:dihydrofolate reductase
MNVLNIVISKNKEYKTENAVVVNDFDSVFEYTKDCESVFVAGGEYFFNEGIKRKECQYLYVTKVFTDLKCDRFFPKIDLDVYQEDESYEFAETKTENSITFQIMRFKRKLNYMMDE